MRANRDKDRAMHICPHCSCALDEIGEDIIIQRRINEEKPTQSLKEVVQENWYLKHCVMIMAVTSIIVFFSSYFYFAQKIHATQPVENANPLGLSLFLVAINLFLLDVAQIVMRYQNKRNVRA